MPTTPTTATSSYRACRRKYPRRAARSLMSKISWHRLLPPKMTSAAATPEECRAASESASPHLISFPPGEGTGNRGDGLEPLPPSGRFKQDPGCLHCQAARIFFVCCCAAAVGSALEQF